MGMFTDMANFMLKSNLGSKNLYDSKYLKDRFNDYKAQFEQDNPTKRYEDEIYAITDKFLKLEPLNYLKFGLYWWAVKRILNQKGFAGYEGDVPLMIADTYLYKNEQGETDEHLTLIAGWEHKSDYNALYVQGNRLFEMKGGKTYVLYDVEWELQRLKG